MNNFFSEEYNNLLSSEEEFEEILLEDLEKDLEFDNAEEIIFR